MLQVYGYDTCIWGGTCSSVKIHSEGLLLFLVLNNAAKIVCLADMNSIVTITGCSVDKKKCFVQITISFIEVWSCHKKHVLTGYQTTHSTSSIIWSLANCNANFCTITTTQWALFYWVVKMFPTRTSLYKGMACLKICLCTYWLTTIKQYVPYLRCSTLGVKACVTTCQTSKFPA